MFLLAAAHALAAVSLFGFAAWWNGGYGRYRDKASIVVDGSNVAGWTLLLIAAGLDFVACVMRAA